MKMLLPDDASRMDALFVGGCGLSALTLAFIPENWPLNAPWLIPIVSKIESYVPMITLVAENSLIPMTTRLFFAISWVIAIIVVVIYLFAFPATVVRALPNNRAFFAFSLVLMPLIVLFFITFPISAEHLNKENWKKPLWTMVTHSKWGLALVGGAYVLTTGMILAMWLQFVRASPRILFGSARTSSSRTATVNRSNDDIR